MRGPFASPPSARELRRAAARTTPRTVHKSRRASILIEAERRDRPANAADALTRIVLPL